MKPLTFALGALLALALPASAKSPFSVPIPGDSRIIYRLAWVDPGASLRSGAVVVDGNHLATDNAYDEVIVAKVYRQLRRKYHVGTVINLRAESDEDEKAARAAGMHFYHVPMRDLHAPNPEQLERFFGVLRAARARQDVVLWHCAGGIGRAGVMAAMVRLTEGWSTQDAVIELIRMGLSYEQASEQLPALNDFAAALGKTPYYPPGWTLGRQSPFDYRSVALKVASGRTVSTSKP